jgi:hypothetical protein
MKFSSASSHFITEIQIFSSAPCPQTPSMRSSLNKRDKDSCPHKATGKIIVLHLCVFKQETGWRKTYFVSRHSLDYTARETGDRTTQEHGCKSGYSPVLQSPSTPPSSPASGTGVVKNRKTRFNKHSAFLFPVNFSRVIMICCYNFHVICKVISLFRTLSSL